MTSRRRSQDNDTREEETTPKFSVSQLISNSYRTLGYDIHVVQGAMARFKISLSDEMTVDQFKQQIEKFLNTK